ncbi:hypothetical protein DSL72_001635 [Monilinia vaccinii-corymbosi]|uniref:Zn(2)-C6 fungal-type domain-containing protein n=1 Tax=Monilinia vaccinii-corymbosi TaxID=61207 RepID=A0A8A3P7P1_9HELO|nr:hypothetical protein DSL72_001635 [Monilinia vaccinii-corymbosi]
MSDHRPSPNPQATPVTSDSEDSSTLPQTAPRPHNRSYRRLERAAGQRPMRTHTACTNCRKKKGKCFLDPFDPVPPCKGCKRRGLADSCELGTSNRGGRRIKKNQGPQAIQSKSPKTSGLPSSVPPFVSSPMSHGSNCIPETPCYSTAPLTTETFYNMHSSLHHNREAGGFPNLNPGFELNQETGNSLQTPSSTMVTSHGSFGRGAPQQHAELPARPASPRGQRMDERIASADLQNPSDTLNLLADVATNVERESNHPHNNEARGINFPKSNGPNAQQGQSSSRLEGSFQYQPFLDGLISAFTIRNMFSSDNEHIHQICYEHMQGLISMINAGSKVGVEAVEALLIFSQWISHCPKGGGNIGRGDEDRVAWMVIGTAIRLGFFLRLDRTAFKPGKNEDLSRFHRERLAWTACYICDRRVSVRVGRAFWSRGLGPLSGLQADNFPTLQPATSHEDNFAMILQANLESIQIFSNAYDILYSSKDNGGWKKMLEGSYAKYLDDFRMGIRSLDDKWRDLDCSELQKGVLRLTHEYLRLYVNAFAYQATMSRALSLSQAQTPSGSRPPIPQIDASASDARFIYESIDAAKSCIQVFNEDIYIEWIRYFPDCYYLFVIFSAVFLYKVRATTTMSDEEREDVRRLITKMIERLEKASTGESHIGTKYSRLLQLLWRSAPKKANRTNQARKHSTFTIKHPSQFQDGNPKRSTTDPTPASHPFTTSLNNSTFSPHDPPLAVPALPSNNQFSWLNLDEVYMFARNNNEGVESIDYLDVGDMNGFGNWVGDAQEGFEFNMLDENGMYESAMDGNWQGDRMPF